MVIKTYKGFNDTINISLDMFLYIAQNRLLHCWFIWQRLSSDKYVLLCKYCRERKLRVPIQIRFATYHSLFDSYDYCFVYLQTGKVITWIWWNYHSFVVLSMKCNDLVYFEWLIIHLSQYQKSFQEKLSLLQVEKSSMSPVKHLELRPNYLP